MDLTALPTQSSNTNDNHSESYNSELASGVSSAHHSMPDSDGENESALDESSSKTLDPNTIILAEALTDTTISWRIHNCKISKKKVTQDVPMLFLYHYDSLDYSVKQTYPLTPALLAKFNTPMTANEAAKLIGISEDLLASPWHVKVIGSLVVFSEALQLAVRLHWTNTGKATQQIYTQSSEDAITAAFKDWQFFGRIDILYKNDKQTLVSIDEQSISDEPLLTIDVSSDYQYLPANHALAIIAKLEADKVELPWFETAILERIG